jgi:hypothetical protein
VTPVGELVAVKVTVTTWPITPGLGAREDIVTTGLAPPLTITDPVAWPVAPRLSATVSVTVKVWLAAVVVNLWNIVFTVTVVVLPSPKFQVYLEIVVPT